VDRGELLATCLVRLAARYDDLRGGRDVVQAWRQRASSTFGRRVEWDEDGASKSGVVRNVDDEGGLMVETDAGSARVVSGELRWL
jgi:biotin-(acetyl-CoA carboxylase) ligase